MMGANLEDFTIDQAAGAFALTAGAIGSLLLVIWQSKCHCKINLCWLFKCERKPSVQEQKKSEGQEVEEQEIIPISDITKKKKVNDIETPDDDVEVMIEPESEAPQKSSELVVVTNP